MNLFIIFLDVLFLIAIGYSIGNLFLFDKSYSSLKKFSLSYALGFGIVGIQLFLFFIAGIKWNILNILAPWVVMFFVYLTKKEDLLIKFKDINIFRKVKRLSNFEKILILSIFSLILFVGIESVMRPIQAWDGWGNWVLKSNVFYTKNGIDPYYFKYTGDEYPLIIPLTVTFGYITIGEIDDAAILLFYFTFYLSLGALFFTESKKFLGLKLSLIFTFLLLSTQNLIRHGGRYEVGQADLAVGFCIFAGSMLLFDYLKFKTKRSLLLLSIILGIASQIKNDTLPFVVLSFLIIIFFTIKSKRYSNLVALLPLPLLLLSWNLFKVVNHLHGNYLVKNILNIQFSRIPDVFLAMLKELFNLQNWNLLWVVFIICLFVFSHEIKKNWLFIAIVLFQLLSYMLAFLITPADPISQIAGASNKLYLHIAPLAVLIIGLLISKSVKPIFT